ncbi:acetyl-CoA carboxylase biotin carboxyl carrier protein [Microbaculum marinum]|uniref:Biotin/lipoyl-containing protein n=1 Tax=Microbaculum marinum TaxID=1764581 RepID=A0AAW9R9Z6_9HYPH
MTSKFDTLSEADIARIGQLVEALDKSGFDYLTLELADFRITVGTGAAVPDGVAAAPPSPAAPVAAKAPVSAAPQATAPAAGAAPAPAAEPVEEGLVDVVATTMGRFYSRPDPKSDPFVTVGSEVTPESSVGLIEVMKLFNAVTAGVTGTVAQICVEDAQFVEYGQVLCRIRPSA